MYADKSVSDSITVVIPVYNRAHLVGETLESLARQTRCPDEVILVDNGSVDDSLSVLQKWAEKMNAHSWNVKVISEARKGAAVARMTGLRRTSSKYVMFFDSDDWMPPCHVETVMKDFINNPNLDISCWNISFHLPDGSRSQRRILPDDPIRNHMVQGLLSTQAYAVRTDFIRSAGGWNPVIGGWDDLELGLRLLLANPRINIESAPRVDVRVHDESISGLGYSHRIGDWERTLDEMERVISNSGYSRRNALIRLVAYRRAILAAHYRREGYPAVARSLLKKALSQPCLNSCQRILLRFAYFYTSIGLPGAGAIFPPLLAP